ncbi:hypothetical protein GQ44DRAFT_633138, partial [Phaeosphaeriaceae sp. PMI808]
LPSSGPGSYLGDDSQLLLTGSTPFTSSEQSINTLAMSSGTENLHNASLSTPMIKDRSSSGSAYTSPQNGVSSSPEQSSLPNSKTDALAPEPSRIEKRRANTMAARRYRQKRVDQMSTLESELKDVKTERDDLKVRCARLEGEVETLRALLQARK